jgi:hypothetical protein
MLLGRSLLGDDPEGADEAFGRSAAAYEELGVEHLAEQARLLLQADALKRLR